ncbi:MAG: adenine-specific methyltransferase EcoRI family protein [Clostridiales bacterium]|nr:MAG: adenine-specific methyltransferase EcoRI family protein [Clostridiales bacterium]
MEYPSYYKYDAINVKKSFRNTKKIIMERWAFQLHLLIVFNPEQFEIIGLGAGDLGREIGIGNDYTEEEMKRFKKENPAYRRGIPFYFEGDKLIVPYARIIIRRKQK